MRIALLAALLLCTSALAGVDSFFSALWTANRDTIPPMPAQAQNVLWNRHNEFTNAAGEYVNSGYGTTNGWVFKPGNQVLYANAASGTQYRTYYAGSYACTTATTLGNGATSFSFAVWVYLTANAASSYAPLLISRGTRLQDFYCTTIQTNITGSVYDSAGSGIGMNQIGALAFNKWTHFTVTWTTKGYFSYYTNGIFATRSTNTINALSVSAPWYLASDYIVDNINRVVNGYMDDETIWVNHELNAAEVLDLYNRGH